MESCCSSPVYTDDHDATLARRAGDRFGVELISPPKIKTIKGLFLLFKVTWALNTLTLLSFKEKDDVRKDATPLAKIPGLLDALLQVIDDWRDIALPKELIKTPRTRSIGVNATVTGFGNEYKASGSNDVSHPKSSNNNSTKGNRCLWQNLWQSSMQTPSLSSVQNHAVPQSSQG